MGLLGNAGGVAADRLAARPGWPLARVRRAMTAAGFLLGALFLVVLAVLVPHRAAPDQQQDQQQQQASTILLDSTIDSSIAEGGVGSSGIVDADGVGVDGGGGRRMVVAITCISLALGLQAVSHAGWYANKLDVAGPRSAGRLQPVTQTFEIRRTGMQQQRSTRDTALRHNSYAWRMSSR